MLVTPTKRPRNTLDEDIKPMLETSTTTLKPRWGFGQDVKPDIDSGRDVKPPYVGLGRYVKPKNGLGRDVKPNTGRRGGTSDVKPVLTAMGQLSVRPPT